MRPTKLSSGPKSAANRGQAAVNTTTALVASPTVPSVRLLRQLTAQGRRPVGNTDVRRGPPGGDGSPPALAAEASAPLSDKLSDTSSTPSAASGGAYSRTTPHSSARRSRNRPHLEHIAVPVDTIPLGDNSYRPGKPPVERGLASDDVRGRLFYLPDKVTSFTIKVGQDTRWRCPTPSGICVHGTTGMNPFHLKGFYDAEFNPVAIDVVPSPASTAPSGHPMARVIRGIMEATALALALDGHDGMTLDFCGSGRIVSDQLHVSIPNYGPRDSNRNQTDRRFEFMSTCLHREVCTCHKFQNVLVVDAIYYMSLRTVMNLISSTIQGRLIAVQHITTHRTDSEIVFEPAGDGEVRCIVPEVSGRPTVYRHSEYWNETPPQLVRKLLYAVGSHGIYEYKLNHSYVDPAPSPSAVLTPTPPPSPANSASVKRPASTDLPSPVSAAPADRFSFSDEEPVEPLSSVSNDAYGWKDVECKFPRHAFAFDGRYAIRDQGGYDVVTLQLPMRLVDTAAAFPVSTDPRTSFATFTSKCRIQFMKKLQDHADSLDSTYPTEAVFTQLVSLAYQRAIRAAASGSALQRTPGFYAHISQDEIITTPRTSWSAWFLGLLAPLTNYDYSSVLQSTLKPLLAKVPVPCYAFFAALGAKRLLGPSPPRSPVPASQARVEPSLLSVEAVGLAAVMVGSSVMTYLRNRGRSAASSAPPAIVISGLVDKPSQMHEEVHRYGACDSAHEAQLVFPALSARIGGQKAVIIREPSDVKVDGDLLEKPSFRSVGPTFRIAHSYANNQHNVLVAIRQRCETACLPTVPSALKKLTKLMRLVGERCPRVGDDFQIKTFGEWSHTSNYSAKKVLGLEKAHALVVLDPTLPVKSLTCESFIKRELVFGKDDPLMSEAEPVGPPAGKPRIVSSLAPEVQVVLGPAISSLSDCCAKKFSLACPTAMYLCTTNEEVGAWMKRCELLCGTTPIEGDATSFDFSQIADVRLGIIDIYKRIGLSRTVTDLLTIFAKSKLYHFRNSNVTLKTTGTNASGASDTTLSNNFANMCTIVGCVASCLPTREMQDEFVNRFADSIGKTFDEVGKPAICMIVGGDDNVIVVAEEYRVHLTPEKLAVFASEVGIKYNFIFPESVLKTTFVSGLFVRARMTDSIRDSQGRCVLDITDSGGDTYALIPTPGFILRKLNWSTVPASIIPDDQLPKHLGEKAYGILSALSVYVPCLTEYLELIVRKYHDPEYSSDLDNEHHRSMRYGKRRNPNPCLIDDEYARDLAWEWFHERYHLTREHVSAFLAVVSDRLSPDTTQDTWHLPHDVTNMIFHVDCM